MKAFTKSEKVGIGIILFFIIIASLTNFRLSLRRARDSERRVDLGSINNALHEYQRDFGFFPYASADGKIKACRGENYPQLVADARNQEQFDYDLYLNGLMPCEWGKDSLRDLADQTYPAYLKTLSSDPVSDRGISYYYLSNGNRFQLYAHLEGGVDEIGFDEAILTRNLKCGGQICNFGRSFAQTPLDKSIEEYENELMKEKGV